MNLSAYNGWELEIIEAYLNSIIRTEPVRIIQVFLLDAQIEVKREMVARDEKPEGCARDERKKTNT